MNVYFKYYSRNALSKKNKANLLIVPTEQMTSLEKKHKVLKKYEIKHSLFFNSSPCKGKQTFIGTVAMQSFFVNQVCRHPNNKYRRRTKAP